MTTGLDSVRARVSHASDHRTPRHGRRLGTFGALVLALLLVIGVLVRLLAPRSSGAPAVPPALRGGGTVVSIRNGGSGLLVVRTPSGKFTPIHLAGKRFQTRDGVPLAPTSVRAGDSVEMRSGAAIVDSAQMQVHVLGIVTVAPDPDGDFMAAQLSPTRTVAIDLGPRTQINGKPSDTVSRRSIREAERVRVVGALDTRLDEITQTSSIDAIVPGRGPG